MGLPANHISEQKFEKHYRVERNEHVCVSLLLCPFRFTLSVVSCLLLCFCFPCLICCSVTMMACFVSCFGISLKQMEELYREPLWVVLLKNDGKLTTEVYNVASAIFSHPEFDNVAMEYFRYFDADNSGMISEDELDNVVDKLNDNVSKNSSISLSASFQKDIKMLYKKYTGGKKNITADDWPIFIKCIFSMVIAHLIVDQKINPKDVEINGFASNGKYDASKSGTFGKVPAGQIENV